MKLKQLSLPLLALSSSFAFAGTMGPVAEFNPSLYFKVGSGGSYSMNTGIDANPTTWDPAIQGYDANVGKTALYSAAIGYNFTPLVSFDFEYIYRPSYHYSKFQTAAASANTLNYSSDSKTRYFNLQSNSVMGNLYLHGKGLSDHLVWNTGYGFSLEPFIGAGLGVAFNTVSNFHTIRSTGVSQSFQPDNLRSSIAWQLSAGLNFYNDGNFNLGAGYRYYNGETFTSESTFIDWQNTTLYPWSGTISANEFFITISYKIDA